MHWGVFGRTPLVAVAVLVLAGCAQPSGSAGSGQSAGSGKLSGSAPIDRWEYDSRYKIAYVAAPDHAAEASIGCLDDERWVVFRVDPLWTDPEFVGRERTVTVRFDGGAPTERSWFSARTGYGIFGNEPGFSDLINQLKNRRSVELSLSESGKELDRHTFTLNGAGAAIETLLSACGKS
jgi:hypothetical protein